MNDRAAFARALAAAETSVSVRKGRVIYSMDPHVARALSAVLAEEARRRQDHGWEQDAELLASAGRPVSK